MTLPTHSASSSVPTLDPLSGLARAVDEFRTLSDTIPAQLVSTFLVVAQNPGIRQRDLPAKVGTTQASISRHISALSDLDRHGKPGLDLVRSIPLVRGERSPQLVLTRAGEALVRRMVDGQVPVSATNGTGDAFERLHWELWTG